MRSSEESEIEMLVVSQGFERGDAGKSISDFSMEDFRGGKLPHFKKGGKRKYRFYYRIGKYPRNSRCPWGYSRWVNVGGKLKLLDRNWDTSG